MQKILSQKNFIRNALITIYVLVVLGISATARATIVEPVFAGHPGASRTYVGEVAMTPNQEFFLIVSENEYYQLQAKADLFGFNGEKVAVRGYEIKRKIGPVENGSSLDPLPGNDDVTEAAPVLVVFGISGVAN